MDNDTTLRRYKGEGKVNFLSHLDRIRPLIESGWPIQAVYDKHKDSLNIKYMQFHRYVTKYIKSESADLPSAAKAKAVEIPPPPVPAIAKQNTEPTQEKLPEPTTSVPMTFFRPNAIPDREKLI